jgi:hypothetical protein
VCSILGAMFGRSPSDVGKRLRSRRRCGGTAASRWLTCFPAHSCRLLTAAYTLFTITWLSWIIMLGGVAGMQASEGLGILEHSAKLPWIPLQAAERFSLWLQAKCGGFLGRSVNVVLNGESYENFVEGCSTTNTTAFIWSVVGLQGSLAECPAGPAWQRGGSKPSPSPASCCCRWTVWFEFFLLILLSVAECGRVRGLYLTKQASCGTPPLASRPALGTARRMRPPHRSSQAALHRNLFLATLLCQHRSSSPWCRCASCWRRTGPTSSLPRTTTCRAPAP